MAQGYDKYELDNQTGQSFRFALNDILEASATQNSGDNSPNTTNTSYPYQVWVDTTNDIVKIRDAATAGSWYSLYSVDSDGKPTGAVSYGSYSISTNDTAGNGGTTAITVDTSQNVGIGSTNPLVPLVVSNAGAAGIELYHGSGFEGIQAYNRSTSAYEDLLFGGANVRLANATGEAARIDSSGRLLVGITSSATTGQAEYAYHQIVGNTVGSTGYGVLRIGKGVAASGGINANTNMGTVTFTDNIGAEFARIEGRTGGVTSSSSYPGQLRLYTTASGDTTPTERMKILSSGQLSTFDSGGFAHAIESSRPAGTSDYFIFGRHSSSDINGTGGTQSLAIYTNGNVANTNNSYGALSDVKLKENIVDASSQWNDLKAIQVRNYNFKEGQTHTQIGVVAQEVELVSPGLVTESPDRDEDGNDLGTTTKSVNYSVLYMKAVKALQEAMQRIETLEAKVAALESA